MPAKHKPQGGAVLTASRVHRRIMELLDQRHEKDVTIRELSTAPGAAHRVDYWAMAKSHSNACVSAYEVKIARADWLRDTKYQQYLPACNELYVVCPSGLIKPEEVCPEVGLLYMHLTESGLRTVKKAPHRTQGLDLAAVYKQALMATTRGAHQSRSERAEQYRAMLADRDATGLVGQRLAKKIAQERAVDRARLERLCERGAAAELYIQAATALGVKVDGPAWKLPKDLQTAIEQLRGIQQPWLSALSQALNQTTNVEMHLQRAVTAANNAATQLAAVAQGTAATTTTTSPPPEN